MIPMKTVTISTERNGGVAVYVDLQVEQVDSKRKTINATHTNYSIKCSTQVSFLIFSILTNLCTYFEVWNKGDVQKLDLYGL
ncbi:hypothetical protein L1887_34746 [Cichorium endivia]|nr:hypothetical protein L1887_34746 [Cichorium endivia]